MNNFLKVVNGRIVNGSNRPVMLRGVNLGGWLMMEGYFLNAPNRPERNFRRQFIRALGPRALDAFDEAFRSSFIRENDVRDIKKFGFNCVRVPFHYRAVEKKPFQYDGKGLYFLDQVLRWAEKYKIWAILDLHAAPGAQNHDWHSDSDGKARLWTGKSYQKRVFSLWEFLADRYKDKECVAGYDLLNEAVIGSSQTLNAFYKKLIKRLRGVDKNHILFIEGDKWAVDIECLDQFKDDNYALSIHHYEPLDFTFNFVPHLSYPLTRKKKGVNRSILRKHLYPYKRISERRGVPIFVGEFGVNTREGVYGEHRPVTIQLPRPRHLEAHTKLAPVLLKVHQPSLHLLPSLRAQCRARRFTSFLPLE